MPDFLFLMHDDTPEAGSDAPSADWGPYLHQLQDTGKLQGGSAIGGGVCARKTGAAPAITAHLSGFIRVAARDLDEALSLLGGNARPNPAATVDMRLSTRVKSAPTVAAAAPPDRVRCRPGVPDAAHSRARSTPLGPRGRGWISPRDP